MDDQGPKTIIEYPFERPLLTTVEVATVVFVFSLMLYGGFVLVFGECGPRRSRILDLLTLLGSNWRALLILMVPLYFRSLRAFLARVTEFPGGKAASPVAQPTEAVNRPQAGGHS